MTVSQKIGEALYAPGAGRRRRPGQSRLPRRRRRSRRRADEDVVDAEIVDEDEAK